jgi:hypothetical protein
MFFGLLVATAFIALLDLRRQATRASLQLLLAPGLRRELPEAVRLHSWHARPGPSVVCLLSGHEGVRHNRDQFLVGVRGADRAMLTASLGNDRYRRDAFRRRMP